LQPLQTLMDDKFVFYLPKPLDYEQIQDIDDLRKRRAASLDSPDGAREHSDAQQSAQKSTHSL
jgi:hypothetical protein